ncbi:uncharacterized protein LOC110428081 [Herrania umbratica]|uniref:Uncharacterized protein LOC110428081 n=1 Tax=Herrania umbratica TaxID=108875 RepID=A0A6J1BJH7_9ROSI|nr:uncharacterized protein LOC110428081 [Herrania umbratica]
MTLWESIQPKFVKTPFDQVSSLTTEVQKVLAVIEGVETVDSSSLRNMVQEYFGQVHKFIDLESSFSSASTKNQDEKLQKLVIRLKDEESLKRKFVEEANGLKAELTNLQEEIDALCRKKGEIESSLKANKKEVKMREVNIFDINEEITSIKSSPTLSESEVNSLKLLRNMLESSREELNNFKWKP